MYLLTQNEVADGCRGTNETGSKYTRRSGAPTHLWVCLVSHRTKAFLVLVNAPSLTTPLVKSQPAGIQVDVIVTGSLVNQDLSENQNVEFSTRKKVDRLEKLRTRIIRVVDFSLYHIKTAADMGELLCRQLTECNSAISIQSALKVFF